ncbi:MAG: PilZ domain-containing protein [Tepidisphaeraceae bacterium]|jgi:hypothetical protein
MSFTEPRFAEAVALLQKMRVDSEQENHRRAKRLKLRLPLLVRPMGEQGPGAKIQAELRDLSPRGLSMALKQTLPEGSSFVVELPSEKDAPAPAPLICTVVHSQPQNDGTCLVGAEFIGRLAEVPKNPDASPTEQQRLRQSILA